MASRLSLVCRLCVALVFLVVPVYCLGGSLDIAVSGVSADISKNIKAHLGITWVSGSQFSTPRRRERYLQSVESRVIQAMRPYGYYFPEVQSKLVEESSENWLLQLTILPGNPMKVRNLVLEVNGEGASLQELIDWQKTWPLGVGSRLDQARWDREKQDALDFATEEGYLEAKFLDHSIEMDLINNQADLTLVMDTGDQWVMGDVRFDQDIVQNYILLPVPRFDKGDPYSSWHVDKLRTDLWKTGYFEQVDVVEQRRNDTTPRRMDFVVTATERFKNTHQGTIGYGSDSEFRAQYSWTRHRISERGDSFNVGLGLQQRDSEYRLSSEYRLPRQTEARQYWSLSGTLRRERRDIVIRPDEDKEDLFKIGSTTINDLLVKGGHTRLRTLGRSQELLAETFFVDYLYEQNEFASGIATVRSPRTREPGTVEDLTPTDGSQTLAVGVDYDWPVIIGNGFKSTGHHERAWLTHSNEAWASDVDFTQLYVSTRRNYLLGEKWLVHLRAEAGYTDVDTEDFLVQIGDEERVVSVTQLPNYYRFKAGGSSSVRGYDYEQLSDNGLGSNHLLTASVELEYNLYKDWSAAIFYDVGNAFNDWDEPRLKNGAGIGVRWYTVAGSIRLDAARALDFTGEPWTIHLTIGTPLL